MSPRAPAPHIAVGIDEAGLGPTLGPLVVAAFATRGSDDDLRARLADAIGEPGVAPPRIEVGDSKQIHSGVRKLARIERTVLATVGWLYGRVPTTAADLFALAGTQTLDLDGEEAPPWYLDLDEALPVAAVGDEIDAACELLARATTLAGIEGIEYRADIVSVPRINRELAAEQRILGGSKNSWSTRALLSRAVELERGNPDENWIVSCDRSGGRSLYASALARAFPTHRVRALEEGPTRSAYTLSPLRTRSTASKLELSFLVHGDRIDPHIAWASCLAKYCRELVMRAFNRYWCTRVHGLRPTAGYPEDARRFIAEVGDLADRLGFAPADWIRSR